MDDLQFRQLLDYFCYSWDGYRRVRKGVKKRISRHMQQLGCRSVDEYFHILERDEGVRQNNFQIIFLRNNLLTYYRDEIKQPAFQKVVNSLAQGGFLITGSHEKLPFESNNCVPFHDQPFIFQKA